MGEIIREYGLAHAAMAARCSARSASSGRGRRRRLPAGQQRLRRRETARWPTDSVDLIVTSIPFSTQYEYTPSYNDFGHTDDNAHFWQQMDFLTPELLRVLQPGRVAAIHVKDRIVPGGMTGLGFQTVAAVPRRGDRPLPQARLRLPRHEDRRHRRRAREQPDLPARLDRAVQGRLAHGRRACPSTCCCSASRRPTAATATPTSRW
jgi:hypothetical protein